MRAARKADGPAIARLWIDHAGRLAASDPARYRQPSDDTFVRVVADHLADPGVDAATFVVAIGDAVVGFAAVRVVPASRFPERHIVPALAETSAEVRALAVDERGRGTDLAGRLIAHVEGWARDHGARRVVADAVMADPEAAAPFRAAGYREVPARYERRLE